MDDIEETTMAGKILNGLLLNEKVEDYYNKDPESYRGRYYAHNNGKFFESDVAAFGFENDRIVGKTHINLEQMVSTAFIVIDHNHGWHGHNNPLIFETMIFENRNGESQWRYSTISEAVLGHHFIVFCLENGLEPFIPFTNE